MLLEVEVELFLSFAVLVADVAFDESAHCYGFSDFYLSNRLLAYRAH